ncbi:dihydrofolate reductase [Sphingosinicellaceae bacterium]|nr:dihydrofolate reductase [Sphingosinicellaceae bacterium]
MISLVVARADNGVIGRDNALPWRIPADLAHFKRLTMGKPIIMGRRTFESIGRPLPGRLNIVLSRDPDWRAEGVTVAASLSDMLANDVPEIAIIGGAQVYAEALPLATHVYLTEVHSAPEGDTWLPAFDAGEWRETAREAHGAAGGQPGYSFVTLERRS